MLVNSLMNIQYCLNIYQNWSYLLSSAPSGTKLLVLKYLKSPGTWSLGLLRQLCSLSLKLFPRPLLDAHPIYNQHSMVTCNIVTWCNIGWSRCNAAHHLSRVHSLGGVWGVSFKPEWGLRGWSSGASALTHSHISNREFENISSWVSHFNINI